jgi:hypothetical protein
MDERASFETRAVLEPRRARLARLALLVPALALVAIAWAGLSGPRSDHTTAAITAPPASAVAPAASAARVLPRPQLPTTVVGLSVKRLDEIPSSGLGRDEEFAIAGWYATTAISDCPPLAAIYRDGSLPDVRGDADTLAFCDRTGVLYASPSGLDQRANAELTSVPVTVVIGVIVPLQLEVVGGQSTQVVVLGRFVEPGAACAATVPTGCRRELLVDHIAWTADG